MCPLLNRVHVLSANAELGTTAGSAQHTMIQCNSARKQMEPGYAIQ
jgi:hypothetical protein